MNVDVKRLIDLRMKLHRMAELAWKEEKTAMQLEKFFKKYKPDEVISIAGTGRAFVFDSFQPGPTVIFRAELDALPITEPDTIFNKSLNDGISHKCGHDGHMTILAGLGEAVSNNRPQKGKIVLLFQPAEETLQGAKAVMEDENFVKLKPDFIFALHNLPNYPKGSIVVKEGNFTAATNGVTIKLFGKTSHAAYPEKAVNPTVHTVKLLQFLYSDIYKNKFKDFVLSTPVYTRIGTGDFGLTPGEAEIKVTLRATEYADLDKMIGLVQDKVKNITFNQNIKYRIEYTDDAPPVFNNPEYTNLLKQIAEEENMQIIVPEKTFKWTEDFGYYTIKYKGVFFGLGIGESPELHDENYEFPDNSIIDGIRIYYALYKKLNF